MSNREGFGNTPPAGDGVHAGAVAFGVNPPNHAMIVERQSAQTRNFAGEQMGLIEAAFLFTFRMQRDRDDQVGAVEGFSLLQLKS
jgi:hypothetical protein